MTFAKRVDRNQPDIVMALRRAGASVQPLHIVGKGCPDLLIGYRGRCYVFEVKDGNRAPNERELSPDEKKWHRDWRGQVAIVESPSQAVEILQGLARLAA